MIWVIININLLAILSIFACLVFCIISGQFMSADRALIVLVKPFTNAFFIEQVTTRHHSCLFLEIILANSALRIFQWVVTSIFLAVFLTDINFRQVLDCFFWCRRSAGAASILHWHSQDLFHESVIAKTSHKVKLKRVNVYHDRRAIHIHNRSFLNDHKSLWSRCHRLHFLNDKLVSLIVSHDSSNDSPLWLRCSNEWLRENSIQKHQGNLSLCSISVLLGLLRGCCGLSRRWCLSLRLLLPWLLNSDLINLTLVLYFFAEGLLTIWAFYLSHLNNWAHLLEFFGADMAIIFLLNKSVWGWNLLVELWLIVSCWHCYLVFNVSF